MEPAGGLRASYGCGSSTGKSDGRHADRLIAGVPLGTWLGAATGWRSAFTMISGLTLVLIVWVIARVPDYPGQASHERLPLHKVFITPGARPVLSVVIAWMLANNILYTFIAPFVAQAGLSGRVDLVLLVFGLAALITIWITGRMVDRHLRLSVLTCLTTFAVVFLLFIWMSRTPVVIYRGVAIWGLIVWWRGNIATDGAGG